MDGIRYIKGGKEHINFNKNSASIAEVGPSKFEFYDLFKGNPQLSEATNNIINENIIDIIDELKPGLEKTIEAVAVRIVDRVFKTFSVDDLFV